MSAQTEVIYKPLSPEELERNFPRLGDLTRQMKKMGLEIIWVLPGPQMETWSEGDQSSAPSVSNT